MSDHWSPGGAFPNGDFGVDLSPIARRVLLSRFVDAYAAHDEKLNGRVRYQVAGRLAFTKAEAVCVAMEAQDPACPLRRQLAEV